ncbi:hypothetical protein H7F15_10825 [Pontibacter sp. Tf4]|uniref:hypothetical protein n=1 Tax=Pontibacter sp. Tf4 TaxID=2761620 RepID=UPI0016248560|nr:hypothetical protein [Pontibacter sp. Tf4]MBB6611531.1 hypothetical protein [Pontibacter sp. Tf4]
MSNIMLEELSKAIGARLFVQFTYNGHTYLVEPHLLGQNQQKEDCLCGWSTEATYAPDAKTGWQCFMLSYVKDLKTLEKRFYRTRPGYDPYDSTMTRIYYRA